MVRLGNQAVLVFADTLGRPRPGHYAFLVDPAEFEQIRERLADHGITTYAEPGHRQQGIDEARDEGGRGLYRDDPDGNAPWRSSPCPTVAGRPATPADRDKDR